MKNELDECAYNGLEILARIIARNHLESLECSNTGTLSNALQLEKCLTEEASIEHR
jgi:hypothetical protein